MGKWSNWSPCVGVTVEKCTVGRKIRGRGIARSEQNGGKPCRGGLVDTNWCNADCQCLAKLIGTDGSGIVGQALATVLAILDAKCFGLRGN